MQLRSILFVLGKILFVLSALFLFPIICAIIYKESIVPFVLPAALSLVLGFLLTLTCKKEQSLYAKDGLICVGLAWILVSLVGCLPYIISGCIPRFADAFSKQFQV